MKPLAFIMSEAQLESLRRDQVLFDSCIVATTDSAVWGQVLEQHGECIPMWELIGEEDALANERMAWSICQTLGEKLKGRLFLEGCDLLWETRGDLYFALAYILNSATMVQRAVESFDGEDIVHFGERNRLMYWDDLYEYPGDLFNSVVAHFALRFQKHARVLHCVASQTSDPRASRALIPLRRVTLPGLGNPIRWISGAFFWHAHEQHAFFDSLSDEDRCRVMLVCTPRDSVQIPQMDTSTLLKLPCCDDGKVEFSADLRQEVLDAVRDISPELADMLGNESCFGFVWGEWGRWLANAVKYVRMGRLLNLAYTPECVMVAHDVHGTERCFTQAMRREGVPTLGIHHASPDLVFLKWHAKIEGAVAVWGDYDAEEITRWRAPGSSVYKVGTLRRDLAQVLAQMHGQPAKRGRYAGPSKVVILTGGHLRPEYPEGSHNAMHRCWEELAGIFAQFKDICFVVKPHPRRDANEFYRQLAAKWPANVMLETRQNAREVLENARVAILMQNYSTVAIDAAASGIPVICWDEVFYEYYRRNFLQDGVVLEARSVAEVKRELGRLLADDSHREELVRRARACLRRAIVAWGDEAAARMRVAIEELAAGAKKGEGRHPDAAARWILDLVMTIEYGMSGGLPWDDEAESRQEAGAKDGESFSRRLGKLKALGRDMTFEHLEMLNPAGLGKFFLDLLVWEKWPALDSARSLPMVLWRVYQALPASIRPDLSTFRSYLVHAFLVDSERYPGSRRCRLLASSIPYVLAPGRVVGFIASLRNSLWRRFLPCGAVLPTSAPEQGEETSP